MGKYWESLTSANNQFSGLKKFKEQVLHGIPSLHLTQIEVGDYIFWCAVYSCVIGKEVNTLEKILQNTSMTSDKTLFSLKRKWSKLIVANIYPVHKALPVEWTIFIGLKLQQIGQEMSNWRPCLRRCKARSKSCNQWYLCFYGKWQHTWLCRNKSSSVLPSVTELHFNHPHYM